MLEAEFDRDGLVKALKVMGVRNERPVMPPNCRVLDMVLPRNGMEARNDDSVWNINHLTMIKRLAKQMAISGLLTNLVACLPFTVRDDVMSDQDFVQLIDLSSQTLSDEWSYGEFPVWQMRGFIHTGFGRVQCVFHHAVAPHQALMWCGEKFKDSEFELSRSVNDCILYLSQTRLEPSGWDWDYGKSKNAEINYAR